LKKEYVMLREIKRLRSVRGSGTELISIYIPAGFNLAEEMVKLKQEHSQSGNIKSDATRGNVQDAIEKMIQYLKLFRETPKNGLAVFAGNISKSQGKTDIELFSMEPPAPLRVNVYRCDSSFFLEPLEDMIEAKDTFALVVMDGRDATIATLKGSHVQVVKKLKSMAHAKMKKGGQSSKRFSRAREEDIGQYYTEVADAVNMLFQQKDFKIRGVIVGGPGPTKENFVKSNKLNYQVKMLGMFDTGYTDESGLDELIEKASDLLKEQEAAQERKVIERFVREISNNGLAAYGYEKTKDAMLRNQVSTLIINKDLELHDVQYKCSACGKVIDKVERGSDRMLKHDDGGTLNVVQTKDAVEELIDIADKNGIEVTFVSGESPLGKEFLMGFAGIGAILRYK